MSEPLRLVFLGSDAIALPWLNWLADEGRSLASIKAIYTQPDRPVGRGQQVQPNAVKTWALARGIPLQQPEKITPEVRTAFEQWGADIGVVMAYGHILRDDFIAIPRLGFLNLHTSLLPKYRGASPIQTAVASGEPRTGVTLMRIVRRLDAGPIAEVETVDIDKLDTAATVETKLAHACVPLMARALDQLANSGLAFTPQDESTATYCRKLEKEDGMLDFTATAADIAARINGLFPWPGCRLEINGQTIKVGLADSLNFQEALLPTDSAQLPLPSLGSVLGLDEVGLRVAAKDGILRLRWLQRPGGRMLPAAEFLRGFPIALGTVLPSQRMPALVASTPFKR